MISKPAAVPGPFSKEEYDMKRALAFTAVMALLISLAAGYAETAFSETAWTTSLTARCASVEEGRQLMRGRTLFHEQIRKKALAFFLQKKDNRRIF